MTLLAAIFAVLFMVTVLCVGFGQALLVSSQKNQISTMLRRAEPAPSKRLLKLMKADEISECRLIGSKRSGKRS